MTDVIYLAPLCQEHERMWCEHDAPVDCECIDGPHPWIKYIAALRRPTQSDALAKCLSDAFLTLEKYSYWIPADEWKAIEEIRQTVAALQEQSK